MKNKLFLTLSLVVVASATTNVRADENDSWWQYVVALIWGNESSLHQGSHGQANPQAQQQKPRPSAPPLDTQSSRPTQTNTQGITNAQLAQVQRDTEEIIDRLFATNEQDSRTQREIYAIKEITVRCIRERSQNCKTVQELRNATNYYLPECLANTVAKKARLLYEKKAAETSGQPAYNPAYLAQQTEDEIKSHALKAIKLNERGALAFFVGQELEKRIAAKVMRDYPAPKPAPVVAPASDEIYEVYVHPKAARYEQSVANIQQGKVHRQGDCCVCMEDFAGAKKRVTLACGHSICPDCLYSCLYKSNNKKCPMCRDIIASDEFPVAYLNQHKN